MRSEGKTWTSKLTGENPFPVLKAEMKGEKLSCSIFYMNELLFITPVHRVLFFYRNDYNFASFSADWLPLVMKAINGCAEDGIVPI